MFFRKLSFGILSLCVARLAMAGYDDYEQASIFDARGAAVPRTLSGLAPEERIDPLSGNLVISHTDLELPGIAGLNLVVRRVYNSKIHSNYAAVGSGDAARIAKGLVFVPPSPVGLGWNLHFGRLANPSLLANEDLTVGRFWESADGTRQLFFQNFSGPGCAMGCLITHNGDRLFEDEGVWKVSTVDGLLLTFEHTAASVDINNPGLFYYLTEIRDVFGNTIDVSYRSNPDPVYMHHFIDSITDTGGRVISFTYGAVGNGGQRLTRIQGAGRTIDYAYGSEGLNPWGPHHAFLTSVELPENLSWDYAYTGLSNGQCATNSQRYCELTSIVYPFGGRVDYVFEHRLFYGPPGQIAAARVVTERSQSGREIEAGTWTYEYNRGPAASDEHTVITRPDNAEEVFTFFGIGDGTWSPLGHAWRAGVLEKRIVRRGGVVFEHEELDWVQSAQISPELWGDPFLGFDLGVFKALLAERRITRGSLQWRTTHTGYNSNHRPRCTEEAGDGQIRYRLRTYLADPDWTAPFRFRNRQTIDLMTANPIPSSICDGAPASLTTVAEDEVFVHSYDAATGNLTRSRLNGVVTDHVYLGDGSLSQRILYQGGSESSPSQGFCTVFTNFSSGQPRRVEFGAAAPGCGSPLYAIERQWNGDGTLERMSNGRGFFSTFQYDGLGRMTGIAPPGESSLGSEFRSEGGFPAVRRTSLGSAWTETVVDGFGRKILDRTSGGRYVRRAYDALGRITFAGTAATSPTSGLGEARTYDPLGRLTRIDHLAGAVTTFLYGTSTFTVTETVIPLTGPVRTSVRTYRAYGDPDSGRLVRVQLPGEAAPGSDMYTYTVGGHLTRAEHAGRVRELSYNPRKKIVSETHPESGTMYRGYDSAGNLRCESISPATCGDANLTHPAALRRYLVDGVGRIVQADYSSSPPTPSITYTYDGPENLATMVDGIGSHTFGYTSMDRLQERTTVVDGESFTTSYAYDGLGLLTSTTYPSGRVIQVARDGNNQVTGLFDVISGQSYVTGVEYHVSGRMNAITTGNGLTTRLGRDVAERPASLRLESGGGDLLSLTYVYDSLGQLRSLQDQLAPSSSSFTYDQRRRLETASGPWGSLDWDYLDSGDRQRMTRDGVATNYNYNASGQLESQTGGINEGYSYDLSGLGQIVNLWNVEESHYQYAYEANGRLTRVERSGPADGGQWSDVVSYGYDGEARRMRETRPGCGGDRLVFFDQAGDRLAEATADGVMLKEWVSLNGRSVAELDVSPVVADRVVLDFGDVEVSAPAVMESIVLTNRLSEDLTVDSVPLVSSAFFSQLIAPFTLPALTDTEWPISFNPPWRAEFSAPITICQENGVNLEVELRGRGVAPVALYDQASVDFGEIALGTLAERTVDLSNTGDAELRITGWNVTVPGLTVLPGGPLTVAAGDSVELTLRFDATLACGGAFEGEISPISNLPVGGLLPITGSGQGFEIDGASSLDFRGTSVGQIAEQALTLRNRAAVALDVEMHFAGFSDFSISGLPAQMAADESVDLTVRYEPRGEFWSPFGDHATVAFARPGCPLTCSNRFRLVGNLPQESAPITGIRPALAFANGELHVAAEVDPELYAGGPRLSYAKRDAASMWTTSDPTEGAAAAYWPTLAVRPDGAVVAQWETSPGNAAYAFDDGMGWGEACVLPGAMPGLKGVAFDASGSVWTLKSQSGSDLIARVFDPAGQCEAGGPEFVVGAGLSADSLAIDSSDIAHLAGVPGASGAGAWGGEVDLNTGAASFQSVESADLWWDGRGADVATNASGDAMLAWSRILFGIDYVPRLHYSTRSAGGAWQSARLLSSASWDVSDPKVAIDANGGAHLAWTDEACSEDISRHLYYATRAGTGQPWQIVEVSSPDIADYPTDVALTLDGNRLVAAWGEPDVGGTLIRLGETEISPASEPPFFADDFESGDTSSWAVTIP